MADKIEIRKIESYAYISNLDPSILKLNQWLNKQGFEFIKIDLLEFQNDFGTLVNYKKNPSPQTLMQLDSICIDQDFYQLLFPSQFFHWELISKPHQIIFRHIVPHEQHIINNTVSPVMTIASKKQKLLADLVRKLRLFKPGSISLISEFEMDKESRFVTMRSYGQNTQLHPDIFYKITDEEMPELHKLLDHTIELSSVNEIALLNFEASYGISNTKVRFITLVTSLESLFNFGKEQIAHTISRHLSIIISANKNDFEENYKKIKKIYHKRSTLVHGGSETVTPEEITNVENLVRIAILFTIYHPFKDRQELFDFCNSKGF